MSLSVETLAVARKYTDDSLAGAGAVAGVPCKIQSITAITGGNRVTFLWTDNNGDDHTSAMDVMDGVDGEDGKGIQSVTVNAQDHLIITYTDGTTVDAGQIEIHSAVDSVNGQTGAVVLDAEDVGALPDNTPIPSKTSDLTNDSGFATTSDVSTALADYTTTADLTTLLAAKQDTLTFDNVPTESSNNPVKSGGIFNAIKAVSDNVDELDSQMQTLANRVDDIEDNYQSVKLYHNIPRLVPKDVTSYITDGTFYKRLAGTDGFELFEDLYVGDYIQMSRAISAYEQTQTYQATGSQYVTIAGLDTRMGDGDGGDSVSVIDYHHAVMVPGQGFGGIQHFGRSRMNSSNNTTGGYVGSEMFITTIGAVVTSGSTATEASINQQLYAEFGSHLKTTRQILSNAMDNTRYNRFGQTSGASSGWAWTTVQAVLMSEVEVYGSIVWSSSGYDTGNGNIQLPLFQHNKQAMNNRNAYYWLKDVASSTNFCNCGNLGYPDCHGASNANHYVRPCFILA